MRSTAKAPTSKAPAWGRACSLTHTLLRISSISCCGSILSFERSRKKRSNGFCSHNTEPATLTVLQQFFESRTKADVLQTTPLSSCLHPPPLLLLSFVKFLQFVYFTVLTVLGFSSTARTVQGQSWTLGVI